jgi:4-diphosphocytidyl-2-C-methyl-D-erythritol kinase
MNRAGRRGRQGAGVRVEARAKLNLGLAVGPRRADGFHDLATVFQSVSLADTLLVTPRGHGFTLRVRHEDASLNRRGGREATGVPGGRANLVLAAARLLAREHGLPGGAHFELVKRIPAGAGLGGGSADAAAALRALAALHGLRLDPGTRLELAARLGSDVPFAIAGGTALGLGRGEKLRPIRLVRPFRALLAVPRWRVSTANAYRQLDRNKYGLTGWSAKLRFAQSLGRKSVTASRAMELGNSFESALGRRTAKFDALRERLGAYGILRTRLTGSGSAVFAILPPRLSAAAIARRFGGDEALYEVTSERVGTRLLRL